MEEEEEEGDKNEREELQRLFTSELLALEWDGVDYEDEDIQQLEDLGKQLRLSLRGSDEGDGDAEWAAMVESSRLQELSFETTIAASASESEELKRRWAAIEDLRLREAQINMGLNQLANNSLSPRAANSQEHTEISSIVRELMSSMLDSVEYTWKIVISKDREVANAIVIDYSKLPKLIADDVEEGTDIEAYAAGLTSYDLNVTSKFELLERERLQESVRFMEDTSVQTILLQEADETARILEEDKQQRLQRKLRMMDEILRAKQSKSAIRIQSRQRGAMARDLACRFREQLRLEKEHNAERLRLKRELELEKDRVQKEIEHKRREFAAEKRELEGMRDEDILSMQVQNWEIICREREAQRKFAEREAERLFAEENYKNGIFDGDFLRDGASTTETVGRSPGNSVVEEPPLVLDRETMDKIEEKEKQDQEESEIALNLMEDPWTRFGDAEEEILLKAQSPRLAPAPLSSESKIKFSKRTKEDSDNDDDDDDDDEDNVNDDNNKSEDEEVSGEGSSAQTVALDKNDEVVLKQPPVVLPLPKLAALSQKELLPATALKYLPEEIEDFWHSLATDAISRALTETLFELHGVEKAVQLLQKKSNVLRIDLVDPIPGDLRSAPSLGEVPLIISPRAKVGGMRLVASRVSPLSKTSAEGTKDDQLLRLKELDKENDFIRLRLAEKDKNRKALYRFVLADEKADRMPRLKRGSTPAVCECPLLCALGCWQKFCDEEINLLRASLARSSVYRGFEDAHGFDSPIAQKKPTPNDQADDEKIRQLGLKRDPVNVKHIELNVEGLHSCSFLRNYTSVSRVELNVNRLCTLDGLKHMSQLEELSVKDNALTDIGALQFTTALQAISLDSNRLTDLSHLSKLPRLISLTANNNNLTSMPLLRGSVQLQRLELYQNQIIEVSVQSLKPLTSLTHLDLGRNKLDYIDGMALSQCVLLQTLVLSQNKLTEVPVPMRLPQLKTLWLSGNKLETLDRWLPIKAVSYLNADDGWPMYGFEREEDAVFGSAHSLAAAAPYHMTGKDYDWPVFMPMLEKLYLQDNMITVVNSSAMLCFPSLTELDLSFNSISDTSKLSVRVLPKLRTLHIQENPISTSTAGTDPLNNWLLSQCFSLNKISGDNLGDSEKLIGMKKMADGRVTKERMLENFLEYGEWSSSVAVTEKVKSDRSGIDAHGFSSCESSCSTVAPFLQMLATFQAEHAVFEANQKAVKKSSQSSTIKNPTSHSLDLVYMDMLKRQVRALLEWNDGSSSSEEVVEAVSGMVSYRSSDSDLRTATILGKYDGKNRFQVQTIAARTIQALFRGHRARDNISKALSSVKYRDEEIDEIDAMLKSMDFGVSEMDLEYIGHISSSSHDPKAPAASNFVNESPLVYGDHRRSKRNSSFGASEMQTADLAVKHENEIPPHLSSWLSENVAKIRQALTGGVTVTSRETPLKSTTMPQSPRPSSAMSESSTITEGSLSSAQEGRLKSGGGKKSHFLNSSGRSHVTANHPTGIIAGHPKLNMQMAQEWGISDPKVAEMMMKRNNRLQGLPANSGLDSATSKRMTVVSGSFGGGKKTVKGKRNAAMPAWALGPPPQGES